MEISLDIENAISNGQMHLVYQPKVNHNMELVGFEVLSRWEVGEREIPPARFIAYFELNGKSFSFGYYVFIKAYSFFYDNGLFDKGLSLSINLSPKQITSEIFSSRVFNFLKGTPRFNRQVIFEITESSEIFNIEEVKSNMDRLKAIGVRFSIDDFGAGYSSFRYLYSLPFDEIKVDKFYVQGTEYLKNSKQRTLNDAFVFLAKSLGLDLVFEGIESDEQFNYLRKHCVLYQGFLFEKPVKKEQVLELVDDIDFIDKIKGL